MNPTRVSALLALAVLLVPVPVLAQETADARARLLVTPDWLAERLDDPELVILHVGPDEAYAREHIPGARHVAFDRISVRRPLGKGSDVRIPLELPPRGELRSGLEELGISDHSRVVVYFAEGWVTPSARVVFTLDWAGLGDRTSLLDGGLDAWKAQGGEVSANTPRVERGRLTLEPPAPGLVVDHDFVRALASGEAPERYALVDGRAGAVYDGVQEDHGKRGHIAGAGSLPWPEVVDEELKLRSPSELRALFRQAGVDEEDAVVGYCHIGQFATLVLFAARTLGHPVHLFDGSMHEWAARDLPVTTDRPSPDGGEG